MLAELSAHHTAWKSTHSHDLTRSYFICGATMNFPQTSPNTMNHDPLETCNIAAVTPKSVVNNKLLMGAYCEAAAWTGKAQQSSFRWAALRVCTDARYPTVALQ
jgi:hypothetical protein